MRRIREVEQQPAARCEQPGERREQRGIPGIVEIAEGGEQQEHPAPAVGQRWQTHIAAQQPAPAVLALAAIAEQVRAQVDAIGIDACRAQALQMASIAAADIQDRAGGLGETGQQAGHLGGGGVIGAMRVKVLVVPAEGVLPPRSFADGIGHPPLPALASRGAPVGGGGATRRVVDGDELVQAVHAAQRSGAQ